jgi:putative endonuclease
MSSESRTRRSGQGPPPPVRARPRLPAGPADGSSSAARVSGSPARLTEAGLSVVARNWRSRLGEIDVVAAGPDLLVFCEVKTRRGDAYGTAAAAVTPAKQARLRRLAAAYLASVDHGPCRVRFDVVTVRWPRGAAPTRRTPHSVRLAVSRSDSRSVRRTCCGRCLVCCSFGHRAWSPTAMAPSRGGRA